LLTDGVYNYTYDDEGNRTRRVEIATGKVTEYVWDYRNRLSSVLFKDAGEVVTKTIEYLYDVSDRRIGKKVDGGTTERYVYDGSNIALVFDGAGNQTHRYLYGTGVDTVLADETATQVLWALADNQGTVRDIVDGNGTILNHVTYDSFGKIVTQTNTGIEFRFGYTGREADSETGLDYYRARYYDSAVGRFISEDPIGFGAGDSNLSRYVSNSPTNFIDPSGLKGGWKSFIGSDPSRYSGLAPWQPRKDKYDEQQRQWAINIVKNNAKYICDAAKRYNITPDAIAGSILWEGIENPFAGGPLGRGQGILQATRPSRSGANDFGIPGKIHTSQYDHGEKSDAAVAEERLLKYRPDANPKWLETPHLKNGRISANVLSVESRRQYLLQRDDTLAIEYIAAIHDLNAERYERIVGANTSARFKNIRDQAGVLGIYYQGGFHKDKQAKLRETLSKLKEGQIYSPRFPKADKPGEDVDALGNWVSQYRTWIKGLLTDCKC
jgi:RHS repeat-associated protein